MRHQNRRIESDVFGLLPSLLAAGREFVHTWRLQGLEERVAVRLYGSIDVLPPVAPFAAATLPNWGAVRSELKPRRVGRPPLCLSHDFCFPPPAGTRPLSGIDGSTVIDADAGLDKLADQVSQTVQWANCLQACVEADAMAFLELGPDAALAGMATGAYRSIPARSLDNFRTLDGVRARLARVLRP